MYDIIVFENLCFRPYKRKCTCTRKYMYSSKQVSHAHCALACEHTALIWGYHASILAAEPKAREKTELRTILFAGSFAAKTITLQPKQVEHVRRAANGACRPPVTTFTTRRPLLPVPEDHVETTSLKARNRKSLVSRNQLSCLANESY